MSCIPIVTGKNLNKDNKISIAFLLSVILLIALGSLILVLSWNWHQSINKSMKEECKFCPIYEKNCPYTDKELLDQEYESGPCSDMGSYEIAWKLSFVGVILGITFIFGSLVRSIKFYNNRKYNGNLLLLREEIKGEKNETRK